MVLTAFRIKSQFLSGAFKGPACHPTSPPAQLTQLPRRTRIPLDNLVSPVGLHLHSFLAWNASPSLECPLNSYSPFTLLSHLLLEVFPVTTLGREAAAFTSLSLWASFTLRLQWNHSLCMFNMLLGQKKREKKGE